MYTLINNNMFFLLLSFHKPQNIYFAVMLFPNHNNNNNRVTGHMCFGWPVCAGALALASRSKRNLLGPSGHVINCDKWAALGALIATIMDFGAGISLLCFFSLVTANFFFSSFRRSFVTAVLLCLSDLTCVASKVHSHRFYKWATDMS